LHFVFEFHLSVKLYSLYFQLGKTYNFSIICPLNLFVSTQIFDVFYYISFSYSVVNDLCRSIERLVGLDGEPCSNVPRTYTQA